MNVPCSCHQVVVVVDWLVEVPVLAEPAREIVTPIDLLREARADPVHHGGHVPLGKLGEQMVVVAHQAVSVDDQAVLLPRSTDEVEERSSIEVVEVDVAPSSPLVGDVVKFGGWLIARFACHFSTLSGRCDTHQSR